jgi:hypothetical protein
MNVSEIVLAIDGQIAKLEQAKAMLSDTTSSTATKSVGRKKRRKMSAAGRAKIAAAQRTRWAKVKRAAKK